MSDLNQFTCTEINIPRMYEGGLSLHQISEQTGRNYSRVRKIISDAGIKFRSRREGIMLRPDRGAKLRGRSRSFSPEALKNMDRANKKSGAERRRESWMNKSGRVMVWVGGKSRGIHVLLMEKRLGRHLKTGEHVHHIDRDPTNNNENNLALVTASGHARLHRFEDKLEGKVRRRSQGRFTKEFVK